jgi:2-polyprenyl-3-methyl-5-hydroxy-6-metoxy-1,4-benzoquinol methylase
LEWRGETGYGSASGKGRTRRLNLTVSSQVISALRDLREQFQQREASFTFRDPAGHLCLTPTHALRRIAPAAVEETLAFLASPLRASLEQKGDLIGSEIFNGSNASSEPGGELWLRHPRIDPISYPWEWTTAQWLAAAELTLGIAEKAADAGWTLKDATPLNIVFRGPRPVFVDVLSFESRTSASSIWLAYGQFVRTFLLPLIAEKYLDWPLHATLFSRDGYEPRALYRSLRFWQRFHPDLLDVVTLATLLEPKSGSGRGANQPRTERDPQLATHILHKRFARLRKQVRRAANLSRESEWRSYEQNASHYSAVDTADKRQFVAMVLERCRPGRVLDVGANTGTFSLLAVAQGSDVVAIDSDAKAIEALWDTADRQHKAVTVLVGNIARPTPAVGWKNCEQLSLLDRLNGGFDMVLMLAVVHHLLLREQAPLGHIGELCASLTRRWLLLEWVPPSDPMFQEWLHGRESLYGHLSEDDLVAAFQASFHLADRAVLANKRVLLLFERHHAAEQGGRVSNA